MADVKWIKLSTTMFDDEKIKLIEKMPDSDTILVIWFKLLAQAGKTNSSGYIFLSENIPYTDEMLATIFDRPISTIRMALETFERMGMIGIDGNSFISISNWEKHQNTEKLQQMKDKNRERQQRFRNKQKIESPKENSNVTVTLRNDTEGEVEVEEDKEYIYTIFSFWNEQDIIKHRKMNQAMQSHINARLQEYNVAELKRAIFNYAKVLNSDAYYWTHKWSLQDFMKPNNVSRFVDEAEPMENFKSNTKKSEGNQRKVARF